MEVVFLFLGGYLQFSRTCTILFILLQCASMITTLLVIDGIEHRMQTRIADNIIQTAHALLRLHQVMLIVVAARLVTVDHHRKIRLFYVLLLLL